MAIHTSMGYGYFCTFLVFRKAEVDIPAGDENHVISEILPLDFQLLHDDDVGL